MSERRAGRYGLVFVSGPNGGTGEQLGDVVEPGSVSQAPPGSLYAELKALSGHVGRWALVVSYASPKSAGAVVADLRAGRRLAPPGGSWTFEAHCGPHGGSQLYAHFAGSSTTAAAAGLPFVPATEVRAHLDLLAAGGMGLRRVARSAGVARATLAPLLYGRAAVDLTGRRVRKKTADRVLSLEVEP